MFVCSRPAKQAKMAHCDENRRGQTGKRWSSGEPDVEPEILEEMGVKMLGDEENCGVQKNSKTVSQVSS